MYVKMRRDGIGSYISDKIDHCFHNWWSFKVRLMPYVLVDSASSMFMTTSMSRSINILCRVHDWNPMYF